MRESVKTFIIEEHHEAFIIWNYAIQQGLIPQSGNTLFHVDEHSDMGTPRFLKSITCLNENLTDIIDFTYKELNIGNFIIPSVFNEIMNRVYWIKRTHKSKHKSVEMYVRSFNNGGKNLIAGKLTELNTEGLGTKGVQTDIKFFNYYLRLIEQLSNQDNIILDFDLDYFSCSGNPNFLEETYVEISEDEFREYCENRYHKIHFLNIGKVDSIEREGRYYFVFNQYDEIYPNKLRQNEEKIRSQIDFFVSFLREKKIIPNIINICRSRYSGYTPLDQWEFIEQNLIEKLNELYSCEIVHIEDLIKKQ